MPKTKFCTGISDISDSYSAFLIDQWGVLHNGDRLGDGVIETLEQLKSRNKYVVILSNSGRRAEYSAQRLEQMGLPRDLYSTIVTSGEMTWQGLKDRDSGIFKNLGNKCYVITQDEDLSLFEDLDVEIVDDIAGADCLVISGINTETKNIVDDYEPILKEAVRHRVKAICANPDSRALRGSKYVFGPGLLARRLQDFGGVVHYIGKPHQPIYQFVIRHLQDKEIYPGETVMIGDSMAHDILGASLVNIDSCLVKTGLHKGTFHKCASPGDVDRSLNMLSMQYNNIKPTYLVDRLEWGTPLPDRKHKKRK